MGDRDILTRYCLDCNKYEMECECNSEVKTPDTIKTSKQLAQEHWAGYVGPYTEKVIKASGGEVNQDVMDFLEYNYIQTFIHGYKHCEEDMAYAINNDFKVGGTE